MAVYKSLDAFIDHLKSQIDQVLLDEVTDAVKEVEHDHIYSDVYPRPAGDYERRYSNGGLGDIENIQGTLTGEGQLEVYNNTTFNKFIDGKGGGGISKNYGSPNQLDGLVNYGDGWNGIHYDVKPWGETNFIDNTQSELVSSGQHIDALKAGLKKRGFNVK